MLKLRMDSVIEDLEVYMEEYAESKGIELEDFVVDFAYIGEWDWGDYSDEEPLNVVIAYVVKNDTCHNSKIANKLGMDVSHHILLSLVHKQYNFNDNEMYLFYEDTQSCCCDVFEPSSFINYCIDKSRHE